MARPAKKSARLGTKLLQIRTALGLSQTEMLKRLGYEESIVYTRISDYELNKRVPPLPLILQYARVAGLHVEDIIDDDFDLPEKLPGNVRYEGPKRKSSSRKKRSVPL
jgi:transcriptional regulator with XRE-family HTH domain